MTQETVRLSDTVERLPPEWPVPLLPTIREQIEHSARTVVVLDDDPTGTQTVHDVPVLTEWSAATLRTELAHRPPILFILTNSRSLDLSAAQAINTEIGRNLVAAARAANREFVVISRSDSTLRGHYPGEVDALAAALGGHFDATLIIPYFLEGGRYTIGNVHYVADGDLLVPAAETPFARDAAFGYTSSNLRHWVEEKSHGRVPAEDVASLTLQHIRTAGPPGVAETLLELTSGRICVVNALSMRDIEVVVSGILEAEAQGKHFLYRTAASFVQVRAGQAPRPLLTRADLELPAQGGGLFVVGSHVPKTSGQLAALLEQTAIERVEIDAAALLDDKHQFDAIASAASAATDALRHNRDIVLYTSRNVIGSNSAGDSAAHSLAIGQRISSGLVAIVQGLGARPRYLVAKGGITASDIATKALKLRRATVLGQILPGVPVWRAGSESVYPDLAYVVFPGNVGGEDALVRIQRELND
jgi:uncharacterized protein YgbK (DUF1537 family)